MGTTINPIHIYSDPAFYSELPCSVVSDEFLDIFLDSPRKVRNAFTILKCHNNSKTNITFLPTNKLTKRQIYYNMDCLREFELLEVVAKVPSSGLVDMYGVPLTFDKYTYMIAPFHFFPETIEQYNYALHLWEQL